MPDNCVWYGVCHTEGQRVKNCVNSTAPIALSQTGVEDLKIWCSHLLPKDYKEGDSVETCCDDIQIGALVNRYKMAEAIFGRCPACTHNLVRHMCDFICSPRHAEFIEVKKTKFHRDRE